MVHFIKYTRSVFVKKKNDPDDDDVAVDTRKKNRGILLGKIVKRRITSPLKGVRALTQNSLSLTTKDVTTDASDVIVVRRSKGGFFFLSFAFESSSSSSQSRRRKHVPRFFCRSGGTIIV